jgi:hypothetical protein
MMNAECEMRNGGDAAKGSLFSFSFLVFRVSSGLAHSAFRILHFAFRI